MISLYITHPISHLFALYSLYCWLSYLLSVTHLLTSLPSSLPINPSSIIPCTISSILAFFYYKASISTPSIHQSLDSLVSTI